MAAERAASSPRLPDLDRTDIELVTIDPPGSRDLDQALHITRDGSGFLISYAIADVAAFVSAGDPVDLEAHRRVMTLYAPHRRTPLHPPVLSEGAASLLPNQVRPALLWTIRTDARGRMTDAEVNRALVRSRAQLSYADAQAEIDSGSPRETLELLSLVGRWRERREIDRGGVSLQTPEQEVVADESGWRLVFRAPLPVEGWNAQISLLTGMAAAHLMLYGQIGVLRTMPPADPGALRTAAADRTGPRDPLGGRAGLPGLRPKPRPAAAAGGGHAERLHLAVPRRRLQGFQRGSAGGGRTRRAGQRLRPRHRTAAPPGGPLRRGDLRGALRRPAGAGLGTSVGWTRCRTRWRTPSAGRRSTSGR